MASASNSKPQNLFWSNGKRSYQSQRMQNGVNRRPRNKNATTASNKCPPIQMTRTPLTTKESNTLGEGLIREKVASASTDPLTSLSLQQPKLTTQPLSLVSLLFLSPSLSSAVTLKHLCERDKQRVRHLILELATTGQEKETVELALGRERGRFREALIQLNKQMISLEKENNRLQSQLHNFQTELAHPETPDSTHLSTSGNRVSGLERADSSPSPSADCDWISLPALPSQHHEEQLAVISNACVSSHTTAECVTVFQHSPVSEKQPPIQETSAGCRESISPHHKVASINTTVDDGQQVVRNAHVQTEAVMCQSDMGSKTRCEVATQTLNTEDSSTQTSSNSFATVPTTAQVSLPTPVMDNAGEIGNISRDSSVRIIGSEISNNMERDTPTVTPEASTGVPMNAAVYINTDFCSGTCVAGEKQLTIENVPSTEDLLSEELELAAALLNTQEWDEGRQAGNWKSPQLPDEPESLLDIAASLNHHSPTPFPALHTTTYDSGSHPGGPMVASRGDNAMNGESDDEWHVISEDSDIVDDIFFLTP